MASRPILRKPRTAEDDTAQVDAAAAPHAGDDTRDSAAELHGGAGSGMSGKPGDDRTQDGMDGDSMATLPTRPGSSIAACGSALQPGVSVGAYRLVELLGHGGCSTVYVAEHA